MGFAVIFVSLVAVAAASTVPWDDQDSALVPCKTNKGENPKSNLSFEWTYNSSPVLENAEKKNRVSVTGDGELLINGFSSKDHGKYTCRIKNKKTLIEENSIDVDDKYKLKGETCFTASCIEAEKCDSPIASPCPFKGEVCCDASKIRDQDRHRCRHFYGECMKGCNAENLLRNADDCEEGTKCCVLV